MSVKNRHLYDCQNHLLIIQMDFTTNTGGGEHTGDIPGLCACSLAISLCMRDRIYMIVGLHVVVNALEEKCGLLYCSNKCAFRGRMRRPPQGQQAGSQ